MKHRLLLTAVSLATLASGVDAHFVLVSPAASLAQNRLGDPQKVAPCGGASGNATRGTPPNPGVPSGAITEMKGGSTFHLLLNETVFHPGHYRVALASIAAQLPPDPAVTTKQTERGPWSVSAEIQNPVVAPVLADGLFPHTERPTQMFEADIAIPNITCKGCVLQVMQFMADHARNTEGDYSYHHCAIVNITADQTKPVDTRWSQQSR